MPLDPAGPALGLLAYQNHASGFRVLPIPATRIAQPHVQFATAVNVAAICDASIAEVTRLGVCPGGSAESRCRWGRNGAASNPTFLIEFVAGGFPKMMRLEGSESFASTDLDFTRDAVARSLCPHHLSLARRGGRLDARMASRRLRNIAFNDISYGDDVCVEPGELDSFYVVQVPFSGRAWLRCGAQETDTRPGRASVPTPTEPLSMRWSADCAQLVLRIERPALDAHLRDILGHALPRPVLFDLGLDMLSGHGRTLYDGIALAVSELSRNDGMVAQSRLAVTTLEQGLMTGLLLAARSNYSEMLERGAPAGSSRMVSDVVDLIESHPEWAHTVATLARDQGVSARSLERAFRRHLGTSPALHLRTVRLRRVNDELRASAPDTVTVTQVARYWGFVNLGRFARFYREYFGESPSQTLRR